MNKKAKKLIILATSLLMIGFILFCGVMTMNKWDFKKLTTFKYQTNNYEITQDFSNILVESSTANIVFVKSTDGKCKVDCYKKEKLIHVVEVVDDTLTIKANDKRKWYDYVGIDFDIEVVTVSLPETSYNNLVVNSNTSDVQIPSGFNFNSINVTVSTGDITTKATTVDGIKIKAGECLFVPAYYGKVTINGNAEILDSRV